MTTRSRSDKGPSGESPALSGTIVRFREGSRAPGAAQTLQELQEDLARADAALEALGRPVYFGFDLAAEDSDLTLLYPLRPCVRS